MKSVKEPKDDFRILLEKKYGKRYSKKGFGKYTAKQQLTVRLLLKKKHAKAERAVADKLKRQKKRKEDVF